jgi:hypothetical protein
MIWFGGGNIFVETVQSKAKIILFVYMNTLNYL